MPDTSNIVITLIFKRMVNYRSSNGSSCHMVHVNDNRHFQYCGFKNQPIVKNPNTI